MPLVYQQDINLTTKIGLWYITENEDFFVQQQIAAGREITHPNKRLQHLAGRFLLKVLFPDFPYHLVQIAHTRKPFIQNDLFHFSISHCGEYATAIVSNNKRVGVDVEMFTSRVLKVNHKFLGNTEQQLIEQLASTQTEQYIQLLTTAWSIKESLFKWYGDGELDFIKHLHIQKWYFIENKGIAYCKILKDANIELEVHFLYLNNNCISWVVS